jgi:hypothetical protein
LLDHAEMKLQVAIDAGEGWAIRFYLATQGQGRGYIERQRMEEERKVQRFESYRTSNKNDAEQRLIDRRKEPMEGIVPAPPIKPIALTDLQERYLSFAGHKT